MHQGPQEWLFHLGKKDNLSVSPCEGIRNLSSVFCPRVAGSSRKAWVGNVWPPSGKGIRPHPSPWVAQSCSELLLECPLPASDVAAALFIRSISWRAPTFWRVHSSRHMTIYKPLPSPSIYPPQHSLGERRISTTQDRTWRNLIHLMAIPDTIHRPICEIAGGKKPIREWLFPHAVND